MSILRALLTLYAVYVMTAWALQFDQRQEIMFNPATDGPIRYEERPKYAVGSYAGSGAAVVAVTPCTSTSAAGTTTCLVTIGGGGSGSMGVSR